MDFSIFAEFFRHCTGNTPYPYQSRFAELPELPNTLELPTGLGKTLTIVISWIWRRRFAPKQMQTVPRRLVICLPLRTLVEQQARIIKAIADQFGIQVHVLIGGAVAQDWDKCLAAEQILIGTRAFRPVK